MTSTLAALAVLLAPIGSDDLEALRSVERKVQRILPEAMEKTVAVRVRVGMQEGYGSGAHIGEGYILTCAHVVEQANPKRIFVILPDGTEHPAERLGMCKLNDYALIRIEKTDLPAFELGDSRSLRLGTWVGALGHPGGPYGDHQPAFSLGKITGLNKALPLMMIGKQYPNAIQMNAQIFGGNSGGPLFDLEGRLLGLNGAILLVNENAYAIPTHLMEPNLETLKKGIPVRGVEIDDPARAFREFQREIPPDALERIVPPEMKRIIDEIEKAIEEGAVAEKLTQGLLEWWNRFYEDREEAPAPRASLGIRVAQHSDEQGGVLVDLVTEGGGAEAAGIKAGDRILAMDGRPVNDTDALLEILGDHRPGDVVTVEVLREGWNKKLRVKLGD